jgi:hypothetical protein
MLGGRRENGGVTVCEAAQERVARGKVCVPSLGFGCDGDAGRRRCGEHVRLRGLPRFRRSTSSIANLRCRGNEPLGRS